jgi:hypothetical protein
VPLLLGSGIDGCGDDEPEPVVLGGFTLRGAVPVATGEVLLLAVLLLWFAPANTINAINTTSEMPAIQLHIPPTASPRFTPGSRGSVKRGSLIAVLLQVRRRVVVSTWKNPPALATVPK